MGNLPAIIRPQESESVTAWLSDHSAEWQAQLHKHGALLFRGFPVVEPAEFRQIAEVVGEVMTYKERTSPRTEIAPQVYTSTDYPKDQVIFPHNEHSYARIVPMKLLFYCSQSAAAGGETPLCDCRKVTASIPPRLLDEFRDKGWMYVRNFGEGIGLDWRVVFQTNDPDDVEAYCRANDIEWEWKPGGKLRTKMIRPAYVKHPVTGDELWFNHATFFHVTTLPGQLGKILRSQYEDMDLPNHTFFGDGSPIADEDVATLREVYLTEKVLFPWQDGDVLVIDNMLTSHARESFTPPRKVMVAMADPYRREDF